MSGQPDVDPAAGRIRPAGAPSDATGSPFRRVIQTLRSGPVKLTFVALAIGCAVWALIVQWDPFVAAISALNPAVILAAFCLSLAFMVVVMMCWRAVLADMGSPLRLAVAVRLYFVSQLGKYVPGGVWNFVAISEMGAAAKVPRARTLTSTIVALLISIVTAGIAAVPGIVATGVFPYEYARWLLILVPVAAVFLVPPVLNRLIDIALRITRRPALEAGMTAGGILTAAAWSLGSWVIAGSGIWVLGIGLGMAPNLLTLTSAIGAYSLAWAAGFVVFFLPAGIGVRELVLGAMLAGQLDSASVLAVVLIARVLVTLADIVLAGASMLLPARTTSQ